MTRTRRRRGRGVKLVTARVMIRLGTPGSVSSLITFVQAPAEAAFDDIKENRRLWAGAGSGCSLIGAEMEYRERYL